MSEIKTITPTGEQPFACPTCDNRYKSVASLKDHILSKHSDIRPHACTFCDKSFTKAYALQIHMYRHTGYRPFVCDVCDKSFDRQQNLKRHRNTHSGEKPFQCTICNKHFISKQNLTEHTRLHTGVRPFACEQCNKRFSTKDTLKHHRLRLHVDEKLYECEQCDRRFAHVTNLKLHMKIHSEARPFQCTWCDRRFRVETAHRSHEKSHFIDRPHACLLCGKRFRSNPELSSHMTTHVGGKPYACRYCGKRYGKPSQRTAHAKTHKGTYECVDCDKRFEDIECLTKHLLFTHGKTRDWEDEESCSSSRRSSLMKNVETNGSIESTNEKTPLITGDVKEKWNFKCHYCVRRFKRAEFREHHMVMCPNRLIEPRLDPTQPMRYRIFKGVLAYMCNVCYSTYYRPHSVTQHMWRVHKTRYLLNGDNGCEIVTPNIDNGGKNVTSKSDLVLGRVYTLTLDTEHVADKRDVKIDPDLGYSCEKCDKKFATECSARMHQLLHADSAHEFKIFACTDCTMTFSWRSLLEIHRESVHGVSAQGVNESSVSDSIRNIENNYDHPYVCMCCENRFKHIHEFYNHYIEHDVESAQVSYGLRRRS